MADPTPSEVNRTDYRWCPTCTAYVHKSHLTQEDGIFDDEKGERCPKGHAVQEARGAAAK